MSRTLFNRFYYRLKPYVPWGLRLEVRRQFAWRKRRQSGHRWPILREAARPPDGWQGWPEGKRFAVVLTHDVEGPGGLAKIRQLAQLEMEEGFRSAFNLIPEGDYQTPPELRHWLTGQGFEVGVHDLNHDGHLYQSREVFRQKAARINRYLKEWGAVGFRSGFMHHNYEWLHDLDVAYDASSFDTDPFEPQPDGVETIFPFWMPAPNSGRPDGSASARGGYLEMPYTLAQDSTVFLLFQEESIDLWQRKAEWVAEQGGMVLLNVHPDYLAFNDQERSQFNFPANQYRSFLKWLKERYAGQFWHGTPATLAAHCRAFNPLPRRPHRPRRVCMVTASVYERDNRVLRYAESLAQRGDTVDIIALQDRTGSPTTGQVPGIQVFHRGTKGGGTGKIRQLLSAFEFLFRSSLLLTMRQLQARYDVVHVHNMPDFLVFAAWLPRLQGAAILLDIHDIFPEFYATRFGVKMDSWLPRLLCAVERLCARFSSHVIVSNHLWKDTLLARSTRPDRSSVFINSVDTTRFTPRARSRRDDTIVFIYPGSFNWHQGLDVAIEAMVLVRQKLPQAELHLYGRGPAREGLKEKAQALGLNGSVRFFDPLPLDRMPDILANADVGVVPKRASDFFGNQAFSTKIMEFMSQGLPIAASRTAVDSYYYDDSMLRFFESENVPELAAVLIQLATDQDLRKRLIANAHQFVAHNCWETKRLEYLDLVDSLVK